ncbi:MAG: 50S ribosomal protein L24 [Firmicutes bacterium]|nr:50S ribosomal protein L24 [Bacillota bacterium]
MSIRRGDRVVVLSGKDKGKKGKVIMALPKEGRVKVEGVNMIKKHAKPTPKVPQGGIREMEAPLPVSKVMLICPACNKPTRIGKRLTADGRRVRTCKKCGEAVDK